MHPQTRADLIREVVQLREDLNTLAKIVVNNRRLIAFLEYTRSSSGWLYVPSAYGPAKGETSADTVHGLKSTTPLTFSPVPIDLLSRHILRGSQL